MTDVTHSEGLAPATRRGTSEPQPGYFFGPLVDFLYLGGGSIIVCGLIALLLPNGISDAGLGGLVIILMTLINQPHFAHSYQIFYRDFRTKAFGQTYAPALRLRYIVAGLVVPAVLILFLGLGVVVGNTTKSARVLSIGANAMLFFVGWHYVKQGYGILIVDSVKKRFRFSDAEKMFFRINGYACWMVAWLSLNHALSKGEPYLGIVYYSFPFPTLLYQCAIVLSVLTSLGTLAILARCWRGMRTLPWNGVVAYLTTLYLWVVFVQINPLVLAIVPTFHSLQYLTVVWRYQLNAGAAPNRKRFFAMRLFPEAVWAQFSIFVLFGVILGYLGFMGVPRFLDMRGFYDRQVFGPALCLFAAYIFINIHHYFLDSVMWRRGNPDVQQFLLGSGQRAP
jgi:hypothetical protein